MNPRSIIQIIAISFVMLLGLNAVPTAVGEPSAQQTSLEYPALAGLARVYFVSPAGDDRNPGTADKPFRTISQAARVLLPGEGVFVHAGTYRERVSPELGGKPGKPIVYFAEPGRRVFLKGSDVWKPAWTHVGKHIYSAVPGEAMFTDDSYWDSANPLHVAVSATPWGREGRAEFEYFNGTAKNNARDRMSKADLEKLLSNCDTNLVFTLGQVFVDGKMFRQMAYRAEMEAAPDSWFYDAKSVRVFVHFADDLSPDRHQVELTTRRRIFAPHKRGLGYIHVIGFVMEDCGNQYPKDFWSARQNGQAGALGTRSGNHWVIRDNVIRFANGFGLDIGAEGQDNERGHDGEPSLQSVGYDLIEDNVIADNGAGGICGMSPKAVRIVGNVIERNNNLRFKGTKRWESAGIKLHTPDACLISGNLFLDNYTHGFWADQGIGKGLRFTRNVIIGNQESEHGVFIEMGEYGPDTGFIEDNIIVGNRNGVYCHDGSGMTVAHNLIANSREYGIQVRQVSARCNTWNNTFFDNLLIGNARPINLNYPAELGGDVRLDGNVYSGSEADRTFVINRYSKFDPPWTDEKFARLIQSDMGSKKLGQDAFTEAGLAKLTFAEWKLFWSKHSKESDDHSEMMPGATVQVDPKTLELTLFVPGKLAGSEVEKSLQVTKDFLGNPIARDGTAIAGPFQNLPAGKLKLMLMKALFTNPPPRPALVEKQSIQASLPRSVDGN